jgi:hypothetical protein
MIPSEATRIHVYDPIDDFHPEHNVLIFSGNQQIGWLKSNLLIGLSSFKFAGLCTDKTGKQYRLYERAGEGE